MMKTGSLPCPRARGWVLHSCVARPPLLLQRLCRPATGSKAVLWWICINEIQHKRYAHRELWYSFCDEHCGGTSDPRWHSSELFNCFLQCIDLHPPLSCEGPMAHGALVGMVKVVVRFSRAERVRWHSHCDSRAKDWSKGPRYDPTLLHPEVLVALLDGCSKVQSNQQRLPPLRKKEQEQFPRPTWRPKQSPALRGCASALVVSA